MGLLLALFLIFGATFIPTKIHYSAPDTPVSTSTLQGAKAAAYVHARAAKDAKFRAAMDKLREKRGVHLAGQIVHVSQKQTSRPAAMTFSGLLARPFTAFAEPITEYVEGGVVVFTPFDGDSIDDSAEFKNGIIAAGGAAGPCVFSNVAWLACVGAAFLGAAAATVGYQAADFIWSCRCPLFGWDCDEEPPPI